MRDPWKVYDQYRATYKRLNEDTGRRYDDLFRRKTKRLFWCRLDELLKRKAGWLYPFVRLDKSLRRMRDLYRAAGR